LTDDSSPRFLFDNNIPPPLANGLTAFGENVVHFLEWWGGTGEVDDEVWLPRAGADGLIVVTRDLRQRRTPAEVLAYRKHRVGGFWLGGKNLSTWQMIEQVIRHWRRMKDMARDTSKPFCWIVPPHGGKIVRGQF